jgi:hypothetical protein
MGSLVEALVNTVIGFVLNLIMNLIILPVYFGHSIGLTANLCMGLLYTVVSVARSYVLRRTFNGWLHKTICRWFPA